MYLISLLCSLYTIDSKISDTKTVIQINASNAVNFDKSNALNSDLGPNTLKSIQIHYNYFDLSMITITLQIQDQ